MRGVAKNSGILFSAVLFSGCYTVKQGYHQARLLTRARSISTVLQEKLETPERLEKLRRVPQILAFAENSLGLIPGNSYRSYVSLREPAVTYVVQAASKRKLEQKTWWFPVVGKQPYLGFFTRSDAEEFQRSLVEEGFDTSLGGVQAFSMLGYFSDPVYSSMLDGNSIAELAEVLIHEIAHSTLYVAGYPSFNENFANFVGVKGAAQFLDANPDIGLNSQTYLSEVERNGNAQKRFGEYLRLVKLRLEKFYERAQGNNGNRMEEQEFLRIRESEFASISKDYSVFMNGVEKGTSYERSFAQGRVNNAVVLGYALYEAHSDLFERIFALSRGDVREFLKVVKSCVEGKHDSEEALWQRVRSCGEKVL